MREEYRALKNQKRLGAIMKALDEGIKSLEEICKRTHLEPRGFRKFIESHNIQLPSDLVPYRYKPNMDAVIDRGGRTLEEIGIAGGYPKRTARENARQYLWKSWQYDYWLKKRKFAKESAQQESSSLNEKKIYVLKTWVTERAKQEGWAHQKAVEYVFSLKYINMLTYEPRVLVNIFENYEKARNAGINASLEQIRRGSGLCVSAVGKILHTVKVKSFNKRKIIGGDYSKRISNIRKAINLKIESSRDIGYFFDMSESLVRRSIKNNRLRVYHTSIPGHIGRQKLTYRQASRIYGAQASGFKRYSDIAELFDTTPEIVRYAIAHKQRIAPKLVNVFRMAYDDPKYDKPYKKGLKV